MNAVALFEDFVSLVPDVIEIMEEKEVEGIKVISLKFKCKEGSTEKEWLADNAIYAITARPAVRPPGKKYPGILVCHGGKGIAEEQKAIGWAKQGYVAMVPELPGWIHDEIVKSSTRFSKEPYGAHRFTVSPGVTSCGVFDSIASGLGAFNLLEQDPDVDSETLGITGCSWGGYLTIMLSGLLGERVHAAFSLYGSGFYEEGSMFQAALLKMSPADSQLWLNCYDAGRVAERIRARLYMMTASNDSFFYPPAVNATFEAAGSRWKRICCGLGTDHQVDLPGGSLPFSAPFFSSAEPIFFANAIQRECTGFPDLKPKEDTDSIGIDFCSELPDEYSTWAYVSEDTEKSWPSRRWTRLDEREEAGSTGRSIRFPKPLSDKFDWVAGISWTMVTEGSAGQISLSTMIQRSGSIGTTNSGEEE